MLPPTCSEGQEGLEGIVGSEGEFGVKLKGGCWEDIVLCRGPMFPGGRLAPFQPARQLSAGTQAPCTSSWDSATFLVSCQLLILYRVVCPAQGRQALDAYLQVGALILRRDGGTTLGCDPDAPNPRAAGISGRAACCRLWCQEPRSAKTWRGYGWDTWRGYGWDTWRGGPGQRLGLSVIG